MTNFKTDRQLPHSACSRNNQLRAPVIDGVPAAIISFISGRKPDSDRSACRCLKVVLQKKTKSLFFGAALALLPASGFANLLSFADMGSWPVGEPPPRPWQHSDRDEGISVRTVIHDDRPWIELRDDSTEKAANLRQEFPAMRAGRLSFRLALGEDHVGEFGIYLGQGNASSPVERIVDVKSSARGLLLLGSARERVETGATISAGMQDHLFVDFSPVGHDLRLRIGRLLHDGTEIPLGENLVLNQAYPVTRLRITTDNIPRGGRVRVTDLVLTPVE